MGDPLLQLLLDGGKVFVEGLQGRRHIARLGFDIVGVEHVVARGVHFRCQAAQCRVGRQLLDPGLVRLDGAVIGVDDQVVQQHAEHDDQYVETREEEVHAVPPGRAWLVGMAG
ncbi:hypothetical protein D3C80_1922230 [compost metagenome]